VDLTIVKMALTVILYTAWYLVMVYLITEKHPLWLVASTALLLGSCWLYGWAAS
jgi:hypothetical protein